MSLYSLSAPGHLDIFALKHKAHQVISAIKYAHAHRISPISETSQVFDSNDCLISGILGELQDGPNLPGQIANLCEQDLKDAYGDLLAVVSLIFYIPALCPLRELFQQVRCADSHEPIDVALEGLTPDDVLREFAWRLDRLACRFYSLPINVH